MAKLKISESLEGELVRFKTKDGLFLHGFLLGGNGRKVVIHVHGLGGNFYRSGLTWALAKKYSDIGYDLFSINTRGHDTVARVGTAGGKRKTIGTAYEPFEQCIYDIAAAINAVQRCGYRKMCCRATAPAARR
jgi:alpha-beta hydrolase superfamily lysophospholipase